jgi:hypothetical protein
MVLAPGTTLATAVLAGVFLLGTVTALLLALRGLTFEWSDARAESGESRLSERSLGPRWEAACPRG